MPPTRFYMSFAMVQEYIRYHRSYVWAAALTDEGQRAKGEGLRELPKERPMELQDTANKKNDQKLKRYSGNDNQQLLPTSNQNLDWKFKDSFKTHVCPSKNTETLKGHNPATPNSEFSLYPKRKDDFNTFKMKYTVYKSSLCISWSICIYNYGAISTLH